MQESGLPTAPIYKTQTLIAAIDYNYHNHRIPARGKDGHRM